MAYSYPYFGYDNNNILAKDIQNRFMQGGANAVRTIENHTDQRLIHQTGNMPKTGTDRGMTQNMSGMAPRGHEMEMGDRAPMERGMKRGMGDRAPMERGMERGMGDRAPMGQEMNLPYEPQTAMAEALRLIADAVKGEAEDRAFYDYMISQAPTAEEKSIIAGIRDDEIKHFRLFRHIYHELTGTALPESEEVTFEKPASYCAGLRKALLGEQSAVKRYRKILFAMTERRHLNMLTDIITDELRHLGLYNYLYAKNNCTD